MPRKRAAAKKKTAPKKKRGPRTRAVAIRKILRNVEEKMSAEDLKATLGDYIRLIQLSKEITDEPKSDITVMWIEE